MENFSGGHGVTPTGRGVRGRGTAEDAAFSVDGVNVDVEALVRDAVSVLGLELAKRLLAIRAFRNTLVVAAAAGFSALVLQLAADLLL